MLKHLEFPGHGFAVAWKFQRLQGGLLQAFGLIILGILLGFFKENGPWNFRATGLGPLHSPPLPPGFQAYSGIILQ